MTDSNTLEPAVDPNNRISFLLDWELTMKCNLDCSYCPTGLDGGHDNSIAHPPLHECLQTVDFMLHYVDLYMSTKPNGLKTVVLNLYGGEALYHPDIVEIIEQIKQRHEIYKQKWHLTITSTTNAIISEKTLTKIIPLIDEFTTSYHTENTEKQKEQFKKNLLTIAQAGKRLKCVVLMHQEPDLFQDANAMIAWLGQHQIKILPRQLDGHIAVDTKRIYNVEQVKWFDKFYRSKSYGQSKVLFDAEQEQGLTDIGRSCCGGRQLCLDQDYKQRHFYVENKFPDWYCSVNHFFLYIKQVTGGIYVNKDCKMNFEGQIGPIGYLDQADKLLDDLIHQVETNNFPVIQCKKSKCLCGLCAPKAKHIRDYKNMMKIYTKVPQ